MATPLVLEDRYCLQQLSGCLILVSCCTARISDKQLRAVRQVHELLELFTQSKLGDTDSTGDAEEYERESESVKFASAHFVLVASCFDLLRSK